MRLRPGLNYNFTVLELDAMLLELFKRDPQHPFTLPRGVVPLCNNSSLDRIRAMMPLCDSHGIVPTWQEPADDVVQAFYSSLDRIRAMMPLCDSHGIVPTWQEPADDVVQAFFVNLEEVPVRADEQKSLTRDTTDEELQRIATRAEEVAAAAATGTFGFTVEEAEAAEAANLAERAEFIGEEEPAGSEAEPSEAGALCDSHGIVPTWQEPADDVVQAFFDNLEEVPVRPDEQKSLTRDTTDEEL